jgi:hypothetical protein
LRVAVTEGRCREWKGLYFLPRASIGKGREWEEKKQLQRQQERTDEDWDTFGEALHSSIGGRDELDDLDNYYGDSVDNTKSIADEASLIAIVEELDQSYARLQKAQKTAESACSSILCSPSSNIPKVRDTLNKLLEKQEEAELILGPVSFVLKFQKIPDGSAMDRHNLGCKLEGVKALIDDIIESIKYLKIVVPQAKK